MQFIDYEFCGVNKSGEFNPEKFLFIDDTTGQMITSIADYIDYIEAKLGATFSLNSNKKAKNL